MLPHAGLQHFVLRLHLERVVRPFADEMHGELLADLHEVPAAKIIRLIHAGEERAERAGRRDAHPRAVAEPVGALKIRDIAKVEIRVLLQFRSQSVATAVLPIQRARRGEFAFRLSRHALHHVAPPFVEQQMDEQFVRGNFLGELPGLRACRPRGEVRLCILAALLHRALRGNHFLRQRLPALRVLRRLRHQQAGRRVLRVAVLRGLHRVAEIRRHRVKILLQDGIKLVVMARRAIHRQAEIHPTERAHAVVRVVRQVLLVNRPALIRGRVAPLKAGRDERVHFLLGQQITGQLH